MSPNITMLFTINPKGTSVVFRVLIWNIDNGKISANINQFSLETILPNNTLLVPLYHKRVGFKTKSFSKL